MKKTWRIVESLEIFVKKPFVVFDGAAESDKEVFSYQLIAHNLVKLFYERGFSIS